MLIAQLLRPFGYLAIRHPYKWIVDWLYPGLLAIAALVFISFHGGYIDFIKGGGLVSLVLSFVQSLPGFYIAALAAVSTFGRSDIDSVLPEPTPKIKIRFRDKENIVSLTRRRFLAMLFAFLTGESILLVVFSIFLLSYGGMVFDFAFWKIDLGGWLAVFSVFLYFLIFFQMVLATFWGLYYLGYKLHE
ncbi:TPA: hypothetical protein NIH23_000208 [Pseudomonas aeruginosa]|uniref:hypothetical protein n=1 Tax=Pseudomonas aeruginosa TaxID=287 RepID=UPI000FD612EC|nr:hypothetical protein [Pseudomonas aeruginosa]MCW5325708.1 hypothetical protein [Pseudomonas aeruginosa]MCW5342598.1 hypothetical protein [Pseudomonas aeruginosa]MDG4094343.1 hypothetical protein [Pseudomonas aeruginosa]MDI3930388.1 hypothetical protein [Pseudomonas aeruginosa]RUE37483.1 hypothetical protein IPC1230_14490 [Pseudomonas aeruginosa]